MADLTLDALKEAAPDKGFFADRQWLWSPRPFELSKRQRKILNGLGHPLHRFQQAGDEIYRQSARGLLPKWISGLLDAGKPDWLVAHQRDPGQAGVAPRVIRPDLLLTEDGFTASELDGVPGGMGTLAWLSKMYAKGGFEIFGGEKGMLEGFASLFPEGGEILVSEESGDYLPEMEWLVEALGGKFSVSQAEKWAGGDREVYRFFELFDLPAIPGAKDLAARGGVTPPFKPHFEEKLWLALFWTPALRRVWSKELRGSHLQRLQQLLPFGWVVDPSEIPPHAALPRLEVASWDEVGKFSQKDRRLVLKVSGFSELAWGSRGVIIGHDVASSEWQSAIAHAQEEFSTQPWVVQEFQETKLVEHPYFDSETGEKRIMVGRARLCPYYFVDGQGETKLGGCLATIVPADKKKIHGMRDGILVPCM
ncbi:hypothetical protein OAF62_01455 [Akkermansiaceae bacterium]|nr:hypothetical protein [Akkermansiaceae bacterium]MDB4734375.1 hypothetical protein [Akkermansiaceae bacterium]